jgi:hypothetical protein
MKLFKWRNIKLATTTEIKFEIKIQTGIMSELQKSEQKCAIILVVIEERIKIIIDERLGDLLKR